MATSEDVPSASIESLAHTRSIIFCPRVGESVGSVRVRFWDSVQERKGSALGEGWAEDCQAGCLRLKSPANRQGWDGTGCAIRESM